MLLSNNDLCTVKQKQSNNFSEKSVCIDMQYYRGCLQNSSNKIGGMIFEGLSFYSFLTGQSKMAVFVCNQLIQSSTLNV